MLVAASNFKDRISPLQETSLPKKIRSYPGTSVSLITLEKKKKKKDTGALTVVLVLLMQSWSHKTVLPIWQSTK